MVEPSDSENLLSACIRYDKEKSMWMADTAYFGKIPKVSLLISVITYALIYLDKLNRSATILF